MVVVVTGANGQLGQAIQSISENYPHIDFIFCDTRTLNVTDLNTIKPIFKQFKPAYCINAAAYTAVDKAESEPEKAHSINVVGAQNIAEVCKEFDCVLLHISTDFVFDGTLSPRAQSRGYSEDDPTNPLGVYGQTKLEGERAIQSTWEKHFIIRTSWLYSQFGSNFKKTMLRLASEKDSISVVNDQIGTPTNAVDLAECLIEIIGHTERSLSADNQQPTTDNFGTYHFSNEGHCSWYDFAKEIFKVNGVKVDLKPIPTTDFPTPAKRPKYSVLDKSKISRILGIQVKTWEESLVLLG
jgi:dTDP-4-dehydrorhamnose reductase